MLERLKASCECLCPRPPLSEGPVYIFLVLCVLRALDVKRMARQP